MHHRCPIYLDSMVKPQTIKCGHVFCQDCLSQALRILNVCPICKEPKDGANHSVHSAFQSPSYSGMLYITLEFQQTCSVVIEKRKRT